MLDPPSYSASTPSASALPAAASTPLDSTLAPSAPGATTPRLPTSAAGRGAHATPASPHGGPPLRAKASRAQLLRDARAAMIAELYKSARQAEVEADAEEEGGAGGAEEKGGGRTKTGTGTAAAVATAASAVADDAPALTAPVAAGDLNAAADAADTDDDRSEASTPLQIVSIVHRRRGSSGAEPTAVSPLVDAGDFGLRSAHASGPQQPGSAVRLPPIGGGDRRGSVGAPRFARLAHHATGGDAPLPPPSQRARSASEYSGDAPSLPTPPGAHRGPRASAGGTASDLPPDGLSPSARLLALGGPLPGTSRRPGARNSGASNGLAGSSSSAAAAPAAAVAAPTHPIGGLPSTDDSLALPRPGFPADDA